MVNPLHYTILLLLFIIIVPTMIWMGYQDEDAPIAGCGTVTPPEWDFSKDKDTVALVLFNSNCAPCHHVFKDATGPSLSRVLPERKEGYLYRFLVNRNTIKLDSVSLGLIKDYVVECPRFPNMSRKDAEKLEGFIRKRIAAL